VSKITIREVGRLCGVALPSAPGKAQCPIRKHKRDDKTFRVFLSRSGDEIWKCWSCDEPENVGDAVALYGQLKQLDRKDAWRQLRDMGYEVPGADRLRPIASARPAASAQVSTKPKIGVRGARNDRVLALPKARLDEWSSLPDEHVNRFLRSRGFSESFDHRSYGVIAMPADCVGFVYVDPMTGTPCRVKVRAIREKRFWNEPRPDPAQPGAKAVAPLWLADRLSLALTPLDSIVITEGELDALALVSVGISNVVSLPDGSASATTVSLEPLCGIFRNWYVAVDQDESGEKAWRYLRDRARDSGAEAFRVAWATLDGDDVRHFKDANEALAAGFARADFVRCIELAGTPRRRVA